MIDIKTYEASHQREIVGLILPIQKDEFQIPITAEEQPDLVDIEAFYQQGNGNFWVALHEDRVVGTISLKDIGNHAVALRKMFVHRDYRGAMYGVAKNLLEHALSWARERKVKAVYLGTTPQFLAAHRFYEKNGFKEVSPDYLPASFPVMKVDKKFYQYDLVSNIR